ncbi:MAG: response regulator [Acidobacteriota bacterium]
MLVEDDAAVRAITRRGLEAQGYSVLVAGDPHQAKELFATHVDEIDLLLTDVVMPQMDGQSLYRLLSGETRSLRVLYMSGYPQTAFAHHEELGPGAPFISKPFTPAELARKVREVLDSS